MTRAEKIKKLVNAVKDWRGSHGGRFPIHPKPTARTRVERWVLELKLPFEPTLATLSSFTSFAQFNAWLRTL